mgnify:CR=1 FL=1
MNELPNPAPVLLPNQVEEKEKLRHFFVSSLAVPLVTISIVIFKSIQYFGNALGSGSSDIERLHAEFITILCALAALLLVTTMVIGRRHGTRALRRLYISQGAILATLILSIPLVSQSFPLHDTLQSTLRSSSTGCKFLSFALYEETGDSCLFELAKTRKDISLCRKISYWQQEEVCVYTVAVASNDATLCSESSRADECRWELDRKNKSGAESSN